jgi:glucokinase
MKRPVALGVDIGGTKTLCLLVDDRRRVLSHFKFKTDPDAGAPEFRKNLLRAAKSLEREARAGRRRLVGAGVGCAGVVDHKTGSLKIAPNLLALEGFLVGPLLEEALGTRVLLGNDVQMGLAAEHGWGAAKGCSNVLGVFFGTGVGGAVVIENRVYRGASDVGGQVGAVLAQPTGGPEAALSHGILDRIAGKAAIASEALVLAVKNWAPYLHRRVGTDLSLVTWGMLRRAIAHKDQRVEEMLRARMSVVGIALSSIVNFLNPEMLVLGGGLMDAMPRLVLREIKDSLREYLVPEVRAVLKIRPARLGGMAVALGAADGALNRWLPS